MARKKKSKKKADPKASHGDAEDSAEADPGQGAKGSSSDEESPPQEKKAAPKKRATPNKKATPKKKRARKKAAKKKSDAGEEAPKAKSKAKSRSTTKKSDEAASEPEAAEPVATAAEPVATTAGPEDEQVSTSKEKASKEKASKKKAAKKPSKKKAAPAAKAKAPEEKRPPEKETDVSEPSDEAAAPAPEPEPETQDLDADGDADAEVQKLLAEVVELAGADEPAEAPDATDDGASPAAAEAEAEGLDAVIEDDLDGSEDLDALIAATVAGAAPEYQVDEPPLDSLDEPGPVEVLDIEADVTEAQPYSEAADAAAEAAEVAPEESPAAPEEPPPSTEEELAGAIDLGDVSSPELRDRLLAQALAHAEMQDARYRVPFSDTGRAGRLKAGVAAILFLLAGVLAVTPPAWVRPDPPARIDAEARGRNIRLALLLQAQQVDAYRVRMQRLPNSLDDLPGRLDGVRYVRSGNGAFQLVAYSPDGGAIVYDSTDPAPAFDRLAQSWTVGGAP